jgi:hypothetical protein
VQILQQNSFKGQIRTSSAGSSNVYVKRDSIFNISLICELKLLHPESYRAKIRMRPVAGGAPVAMKRRTVNR